MSKTSIRIAALAAVLCAGPVLAAAQSSTSAATPAPAGQPVNPPAGQPVNPPAADTAAAPTSANTGVAANANATAPRLTAGPAVKDNTGATIGQISALKADASGKQLATIKMGDKSFSVDAANLAVQNGAAVINLTQAQITSMVQKTKP